MPKLYKQIAIKWPPDLVERLDACTAKMQRDNPGAVITRSSVVRILVERGLAQEGFAPKQGRAKKKK